jgi:hypothetical protein
MKFLLFFLLFLLAFHYPSIYTWIIIPVNTFSRRNVMTNGFRKTAAYVKNVVSDLQSLTGTWVDLALFDMKGIRKRLFFPLQTFWLFLEQVISGNISCFGTVQKMLALSCSRNNKRTSQNTAAYCKARKRLSIELIEKICFGISESIESLVKKTGSWWGRSVKVVDGTCISMPDTNSNQERFPQSVRQKKGCGFPSMRLAVMFSLATGAIFRMAYDAIFVHERTLFRRLWEWLKSGDIILADRGFVGYADFYLLKQKDVDCVMRSHSSRVKGVKKHQRLGRRDYLVIWTKTSRCYDWLSRQAWRAIPNEMIVRQITFNIDVKGFRPNQITVATTLLDAKAFPKEFFYDLYRKRWYAELLIRDIKTTMGMDKLKCKTPQMVIKELHMYIIAYNLIRCLMLRAAQEYFSNTLRISFKGAISSILMWAPKIAVCHDESEHSYWMKNLLYYIAHNIVPHRPDRYEPRVKKRRGNSYSFLTKPRQEYRRMA